jgi:hypothetical protein
LVAVTEKRTKQEIDAYVAALNHLSVGAVATHA